MSFIKLPPVIAHRGASAQTPENTMAAFQRAAHQGAAWIECDVQCSSDNVPVIIHDDNLDRTTNGSGLVSEHSWAQLQALDAGSWFDAAYKNELLVALPQLLDWAHQHGISLNLEIKATANHKATINTARICAPIIAKAIHKQDLIVSSFNTDALAVIKETAPTIPLGLLIDIENPQHWLQQQHSIQQQYESLGCISLHINRHACNPQVIHAANFAHQIAIFTVNDSELAQKLYAMGIDAVFSDHPHMDAL